MECGTLESSQETFFQGRGIFTIQGFLIEIRRERQDFMSPYLPNFCFDLKKNAPKAETSVQFKTITVMFAWGQFEFCFIALTRPRPIGLFFSSPMSSIVSRKLVFHHREKDMQQLGK
jgi:hypothetical protein